MRNHHLLFVAACAAFSTTPAFAQTTHLVGPGGFAQIDDALAVAAPGDVVLVAPGSYLGFSANVGVILRAATPGTVTVNESSANVPAQQYLHLADLTLFGLSIGGNGTTTVDRCSTPQFSGGYKVLSGRVHFQDCSVTAQSWPVFHVPGLHATGGRITAVDCTFRGQKGDHEIGGPVGEGILLQDCSFRGSHLTVFGGNSWYTSSGQPQMNPQPALRATNSEVWISDSSLSPGVHLGGSIPAIPAPCTVAAPSGRLVRCQITTAVCGSIATTGRALGVHRPNAYQTPGQFTLEFRTDPGEPVAVFASGDLAETQLPQLEQTLLLEPATTVPIALLPSDATGFATATWNLPAGLEDRTWWVQGFSNFSLPIQASPVVGGLAR